MKNVQIPHELLLDIVRYILTVDNGQEPMPELRNRVINGILSKLERIEQHENYSKYKAATTEKEKEEYKNKYFDSIGIPEEYRW